MKMYTTEQLQPFKKIIKLKLKNKQNLRNFSESCVEMQLPVLIRNERNWNFYF